MTTDAQPLDKLDITLNPVDTMSVYYALKLYIKKLRKLAKGAHDAGKEKESTSWNTEADALETQLIEPGVEELFLRRYHKDAVHQGLEQLATNMGAASGTLRGIGWLTEAGRAKGRSDEIRSELMPKFSDQTELRLDKPTQPDSGD